MSTMRARLRERLTSDYVPLLLRAGFHGPARIGGNGAFFEYRTESLWIELTVLATDHNE